jgi:uncharacterized protein
MWRKLAPREYGFFDLFNRHANTTLEGTRRLVKLVETWPNGSTEMSRIEELEHECDSITHMTIDLLHRTFITPLDRDEIHNLISKLDDIMDTVEVAARRMQLFEIQSCPGNLVEMVRVLNQSTELVVQTVSLLKNLKHTKELQELFEEINRLENVGDALFHAALLDLFKNSGNDPLTLIKLKEIFETIEWAIDRCEDVANTVEGIVLEHF